MVFDKLIKNVQHGLNCGVTLDNTMLIDNDFLGLGYQLIECTECHNQYIIFRDINGTMHIENYDDSLGLFLDNVIDTIKEFNNYKNDFYNKGYNIYSNINEYIKYPLGNELIIKSIQDLKYGTETNVNMEFSEAINYLKPNK